MAAEIRIIPSRKYVRLHYQPAHKFDDVVRHFQEAAEKKEGNDFVEGLMYSENEAVVMTGTMTDEAEPDKAILISQ